MFGSEVWGTRTAGFPLATAQTIYINRPLNQFQRQKVAEAQSVVYRESPDRDSMSPSQFHDRVQTKFNEWHFKQVGIDRVGFGGMIRRQQLDVYVKAAGSSILKGTMGLQPTLYPGAAIPLVTVNIHAAPLAMRANDIENLSQKCSREILKVLQLSTNGKVADLQRRLKNHYKV